MTVDSRRDFDSILDAHPLRPFQILTAVLTACVGLIDGYDTQVIALVAPDIARGWNVPVPAFAIVFSLGLLGAVIGAAIFGTIGDRIGRKPTLLVAIALFGVLSIATPLAGSLGWLVAFRFATGVGLGGALVLVISIVADYAPPRMRSTVISVVFCSYPLGIVLAGVVTVPLVHAFGWPAVFVVGGVVPLLLLPVLAAYYPESVRILIARGNSAALERLVGRLHLADLHAADVTVSEAPPRPPVRALFAQGRAGGTVLIWATLFLSLLLSYFLNSWITTLARNAGFDGASAILGSAALNLGGVVGSLVFGRLSDRYRASAVIGVGYLVGGVAIAAIGQVSGHSALLLGTALIAGFFAFGAQLSTVALCANFYAASERGTGIGWSTAVGRVGGIVGPSVGGLLLAVGFGPPAIFAFAGAVSLAAAVAVLAMRFVTVDDRAPGRAAASKPGDVKPVG
jgi:AAHS family 4-hydroxybenzoate transporter-like MFS transporter